MTKPTVSEFAQTITLQDIASRCGVAKITVSYALRGETSHVSPATRERILAAANELGYNPAAHHMARRLALRKGGGARAINHVVALFFPTVLAKGEYFGGLFNGIYQALIADRFALLACDINLQQTDPVEELPLAFDRGDVDGAILYCTHTGEWLTRLRAKAHFKDRPLVTLFSPYPGCSAVLTDDRGGAYAAASHLLNLGHRYLAHYYQGGTYLDDERLAGCRQAYRDQGLDPAQYLRYLRFREYRNLEAQEELIAQLRAHPKVTAIMARHDFAALYTYEALARHDFRVPQEYSLIGFDDTDRLPDAHGQNQLTTIRLPLADVGAQAARLMIEQIHGRAPIGNLPALPTKLILRGSTAPPGSGCSSAS